MTTPLIGITTSSDRNRNGFPYSYVLDAYVQSIQTAGGLPVLLPNTLTRREIEAMRSRLDGILLTGGADVDPQRYGGRPHPRVYGLDSARDAIEIALVETAARTEWPFLGICRGIQVINITLGGSLYTDIHDQKTDALKHDWYPDIPRETIAHPVSVAENSRLAAILGGTEFPVNSLHHQGIEELAEPLTPLAWAPDGLVEAVELGGHPFGIGVQWHPEWLQAHEPMRSLFKAFVTAASA